MSSLMIALGSMRLRREFKKDIMKSKREIPIFSKIPELELKLSKWKLRAIGFFFGIIGPRDRSTIEIP